METLTTRPPAAARWSGSHGFRASAGGGGDGLRSPRMVQFWGTGRDVLPQLHAATAARRCPRRNRRAETICASAQSASTENDTLSLASPAADAVQTGNWKWNEYNVRYQVAGAGNGGVPVVLIHGFGSNCDHWRKNIPVLAESRRVYAIDLLGYGFSDKPSPRGRPRNSLYCFENWGQQVLDFCDEVVGGAAFLVCNSVGGLVGLQSALMAPDKVKGVLLMNISLRMLHVKKQSWFARPFVRALQYVLATTNIGNSFFKSVATPASVKKVLRQCYHNEAAVTDELVEKILTPGLLPGASDVFLDFICYSTGPLPEELLPRMECPVLILWGEKDPWENVELGRKYGDYSTVEDFVVLPDVGHCPQDEAPHLHWTNHLAPLHGLGPFSGSSDHRLGFAQAQPANSTLALGAESKCSNRVLLADISPPGMWPSTDDQDPDPGTVDEFRRRLIANPLGPPAPVVAAKLESWFDLDSILGDGEDRFLKGALTADISYPQLCWPVPLTVEQVKEMGKAVRRAVEAIHEYFSSGFPVVIAVLTGDNLSPPSSHHHPPAVRLDQQLEAFQHSSAAAGSHALAHALGGIRATSGNNDSSRRETGFKEGGSKRRSLLQAYNSPPGMWPDADDDDHFSELEMLARRRLMTLGAISRLGIWQVSNDEVGLRRRELLADISPPGMWPDVDDCFPLDRYLEFPDEFPDDL